MARPAGKRMNGSAFRELMRRNGLSMTEVAERAGISLATLSGLVTDNHRASDRTIRQVCDAMQVAEDGALFPAFAGWDDPTRAPRAVALPDERAS